jgi:hypothetical protein
VWVVLYEPVLQARSGGQAVMRDQLIHLADMAQRERIISQGAEPLSGRFATPDAARCGPSVS